MTILYTSHYMEEVQELSHHIAIMDHGKIIACGTNQELVKIVGELDRVDLTVLGEMDRVSNIWSKVDGVKKVTYQDGTASLLVDDSNQVLPGLFEASAQVGVRINSVNIQEPNLETVFIQLTGHALRD